MNEPEYITEAEEVAVTQAITRIEPILTLQPVMNLTVAKERLREFQQFVKEYLKEGEDFGTIPGTPKPTLYKPGADKLCELYGIADEYSILDKTEDFDKGLFDYNVQCRLLSRRDGSLVATGLGSCNSYEGRYRWRDSKPKCPACGAETIFAAKDGSGYYCWTKKGGCGQKFPPENQAIRQQQGGKVQNEDIATLKNTILKMAKKRAKVDATLAATRSSGIFTQDVEDFASAPDEHTVTPQPAVQAPPPVAKPVAAQNQQTSKPVQRPQFTETGTMDGDLLYCNPSVAETDGQYGKYLELEWMAKIEGKPRPQHAKHFPNRKNQHWPHIYNAIKESHAHRSVFKTERKGKYLNIVDVISIDGRDYENGVPVIQLNEDVKHMDVPNDEDLPF